MATISNSSVTVPMIKNDKLEPSISQKVAHMDVDALFKNAEIKHTKPQYELVPAMDVEESLTSELVDLEKELKAAKKKKDGKLVKEIESKINEINNRLYDIMQTFEV
jgi:hypothetical protein